MKQYSLIELLQQAAEHFENLKADKLYATGDGQFFLDENRALLHATPNKLRVYPLVNEPVEEAPAPITPAHEVDTHGDTPPAPTPEPADGGAINDASEPDAEPINPEPKKTKRLKK